MLNGDPPIEKPEILQVEMYNVGDRSECLRVISRLFDLPEFENTIQEERNRLDHQKQLYDRQR